jgi:hypothetical protein
VSVDPKTYSMTVSLNVLDHLGLNLYSSTPAVLSEAVANSWDADAENVWITIDRSAGTITIADDGLGMGLHDLNEKFLAVGYRRRDSQPVLTLRHGRHVMGRKGIGKLSLFAIANTVTVESVVLDSDGKPTEKNGLVMRSSDIRQAAADGLAYHPTPLEPADVGIDRGTRIVITELKHRATALTESALRTRLARRFSVLGDEFHFQVSVDGEPIGIQDRDYFAKVEYLWSIGDVQDHFASQSTKAKRKNRIAGLIDEDTGLVVTGWVGTLDEQKSIDEQNNTVVLHAWGKLVQEDILKEVKAGGLYTKYLMGEIRADVLDADDAADIATSDRQRVQEDDPRYQKVLEWFRLTVLPTVEKAWSDWRAESALETALDIPEVKEWYEKLSTDHKRFAKQLFGKIGRFPKERDAEKRELYRFTILAFERLRFRDSLTQIEKLREDPDTALFEAVFEGIEDLEAAGYHEIVRGRLEVIESFIDIAEHEKERVIQRYLFDHLWLLHPSWDRATSNARIEESVKTEFAKLDEKLTDEERRSRVDIRYVTAAGKHVIVELKKYGAHVDVFDLAKQVDKYRRVLRKVLREKFGQHDPDIEIIVLVGRDLSPADKDPQERAEMLRSMNARILPYDQLIQESFDAYKEYVDVNRRFSKLSELLDRLTAENPEQ